MSRQQAETVAAILAVQSGQTYFVCEIVAEMDVAHAEVFNRERAKRKADEG